MKKYIAVLLLLISSLSLAQMKSYQISGTLLSDADDSPLESATVFLESVKDSTLVTYTITNQKGDFKLEGKTYDKELTLNISYVGFEGYSRKIAIEDNLELDLGAVSLSENTNQLKEVVVRARAPITVKKDTLEFNVKSFKTKKDANVEDLLKELPGVEVDDEGKITVNGKEVNKILVNGKPFFGDDPTITTRNLTKEIIEKVQITDTKTDAEAFAGEEGDRDNKTINLTIKEENNKGVFGRVAAGGGTDKRYEYAGIMNIFDNDQRISFLAGGNNINSPGFSFGEIQKMFGGGRSIYFDSGGSFRIDGRSFGGGQGITRSNNIGANYADDYGEKVDLTADYFFAGSNSDNETLTSRENILPDERYFTNSSSISFNNNDSHNANLRLNVKPDSTWLINVRPSFTFSKGLTRLDSREESRDENDVLTNQSTTDSDVENLAKNFRNRFDATKRFGSRGAFLKFSMTNEFNNTESDDFLNSETNIFGTTPDNIVRNQYTDSERKLNSLFTRVTYRLPLVANKVFLDFKYSLRSDRTDNIESTFDFDTTTQGFTDFNTDLSTDFVYKNRRSTPGLSININQEKWSWSLDGGYVFRTLENSDRLRPNLNLKRSFKALELGTYISRNFSPQTSLYAGYNLFNSPPQLEQLQAFQDVSDPLNTVTGNPNLEPTNNHSFFGGFNNYNFQKGTGFYVYANVQVVDNQVVSKTTIDENFVRNTTYENVKGNYSLNGSASFNRKIKLDSINSLRYNLGAYTNINKAVNFNNGVKYSSNNISVTPNIRLTYKWKKVLELSPSYNLSISKATFDLADFEDQEFLTHSLGIRTATFVPKKLEWRNEIRYNYNPNVAEGFQKSAWFWNTTFAYSVLKDQGTISLKIYDLLDQNTNAGRTATANYIQDSQSTVLQQYVMLGFSWKFNSLGKKGEVSDGWSDFH